MNATARFDTSMPSPPAVGLTRVINNSVALVVLDLLNKAIPLWCSHE